MIAAVTISASITIPHGVKYATATLAVRVHSEDEARGFGYRRANEEWPASDGWEQHRVGVAMVPAEWLADPDPPKEPK